VGADRAFQRCNPALPDLRPPPRPWPPLASTHPTAAAPASGRRPRLWLPPPRLTATHPAATAPASGRCARPWPPPLQSAATHPAVAVPAAGATPAPGRGLRRWRRPRRWLPPLPLADARARGRRHRRWPPPTLLSPAPPLWPPPPLARPPPPVAVATASAAPAPDCFSCGFPPPPPLAPPPSLAAAPAGGQWRRPRRVRGRQEGRPSVAGGGWWVLG